jgi:hypothetical protein
VAHRARHSLPGSILPGSILEIRYRRTGRHAGRYVHTFGPNVGLTLGPGRSRATLYHRRRQPIWAFESDPDYDRWVAKDHRRRNVSNPRRRRRSGGGDDDLVKWALMAVAGWFVFRGLNTAAGGAVSTGGQAIIPQSSGTIWYNDPFSGGYGEFFRGSLPPGSAPPWRLASEVEQQQMQGNLLAGVLYEAGGGLIAPNPGFFT